MKFFKSTLILALVLLSSQAFSQRYVRLRNDSVYQFNAPRYVGDSVNFSINEEGRSSSSDRYRAALKDVKYVFDSSINKIFVPAVKKYTQYGSDNFPLKKPSYITKDIQYFFKGEYSSGTSVNVSVSVGSGGPAPSVSVSKSQGEIVGPIYAKRNHEDSLIIVRVASGTRSQRKKERVNYQSITDGLEKFVNIPEEYELDWIGYDIKKFIIRWFEKNTAPLDSSGQLVIISQSSKVKEPVGIVVGNEEYTISPGKHLKIAIPELLSVPIRTLDDTPYDITCVIGHQDALVYYELKEKTRRKFREVKVQPIKPNEARRLIQSN